MEPLNIHIPQQPARRRLLQVCALLALCALLPHSLAEVPAAGERQIKAAFLYKFPAYIEWPESSFAAPEAPFRIGLVGDEELANELARLVTGRTINGRSVVVHKRADHGEKLHMLFVGAAADARLPDLLQQHQGQALLTVTESPDALGHGSMINFVVIDGRLRFEIAPRTASGAGISISSRLLAVAWKVLGS